MNELNTIREKNGVQGLLRVLAADAKTLAGTASVCTNYPQIGEIDLECLNMAIAMVHRDELLLGALVELAHKSDEQMLINQSVTAWAERIRKEAEASDS